MDLHLVHRTDWPKNTHDLRPCQNNTILTDGLNAVYARNVERAYFVNWQLSVDDSMEKYVAKTYDIENCNDFEINEN